MLRPPLRWSCLALVLMLAGCATRSGEVRPLAADPAQFGQWSCEAIADERDRVQQRAADVAYAVDARAGNNVIALSLGVTVFWPALLAMRADGPDAAELAQLKGRDEALRDASERRACPPPASTLSAERAAQLPLALGERLVYEERALARRGAVRELGLRMSALKREHIEFEADVGGKRLALQWRQDMAGNVLPMSSSTALVYWTRLLRRDLALGDVLLGEVRNTDTDIVGRLRGQVIALGVQTQYGRPFDAAVIELFGDLPVGLEGGLSSRIDGVMVVDRKSGVLLRLELRSGNPDFALRRTLMRVEPAA
jgi:hypothetical protein